jgi:hypothetical protein
MCKQSNDNSDNNAADKDDDDDNNHCKILISHNDVAEDSDRAVEGTSVLCNVRNYLHVDTA